VRTTRYSRETPHVKHRGTHGLARETRTARLGGFDDALLVGPDGNVTEGTTWNLLLHDGHSWVWPTAPMLPGVTARLVRSAMEKSGAAHRTEPVDARDVPAFAAAFALNASVPGRAITAVDGHWITGHPQATAELQQLWDSVIPEPLA
jgi:branched-subunit amino acid aminotransferase/4-amino-4-deoxychorismate lyase